MPQSFTFRLADSLPKVVLDQWREELARLSEEAATLDRRIRIEHALDRGHGEALLSDDRIAELVEQALLHFDGERYRLLSWTIMPNHVHAVASPLSTWTLDKIVHSWKSFTATKANALLGRTGAFWAREYFDRAIRDDEHYANVMSYVAMNPVKAGLCSREEDWRYSSAWSGRR
ncbi:MAG: REP-associated tyrosine transposase [Micropepsaceae bacterium]